MSRDLAVLRLESHRPVSVGVQTVGRSWSDHRLMESEYQAPVRIISYHNIIEGHAHIQTRRLLRPLSTPLTTQSATCGTVSAVCSVGTESATMLLHSLCDSPASPFASQLPTSSSQPHVPPSRRKLRIPRCGSSFICSLDRQLLQSDPIQMHLRRSAQVREQG